MQRVRLIGLLIVFGACSLTSCGTVSNLSESDQRQQPKTHTGANPINNNSPDSQQAEEDQSFGGTPQHTLTPEAILAEVHNQIDRIEICDFSFDQEASQRFSEVYAVGNDQYLVQLLCFMAAYQGNYQFVRVDASTEDLKIQPLGLELAGFPSFDPTTNLLSNSYKYTGPGACIEETQHHWDGNQLQLISSKLVENIPDGCKDFRSSLSE